MNKILAISIAVVIINNNNNEDNFRYRHYYHYHYSCLALIAKLLFTIEYKLLDKCNCNNTINTLSKNMIEIYSFQH